jgi:asparagine synthase (glutamine-hydrolysing)
MCGITGVGFRDAERVVGDDVLLRMVDTLRHRGPDGCGQYIAPGVGLGVRRLSIIDPKTGNQPIANETESTFVICNGEIYNHVELRGELEAAGHVFRTHSDAEVIVHLYEDHGADCVQRLRGMFALAVWDGDRRTLFLARDRLGIKPLYYAISEEGIWFGSEQKAILAADAVDRAIDFSTLRQLLNLGFIVAPATLFVNIRQILPGTCLLYREGRASINRYWDLAFPPRGEEPRRSEASWAEALGEKLDEVVRLHLRSDVPVGAWLSGGLDSSVVVALMCRYVREPIRTFTLGFEVGGLDEIRTQRTLLDEPGFSLDNRMAICGQESFALHRDALWYAEDPSLSGIEVPRLLLGRAAAERVKTVLTGEGSDEMFGGYRRFELEKLSRLVTWLPGAVRRPLAEVFLRSRGRWARDLFTAPREVGIQRYRASVNETRLGVMESLLAPEARRSIGRLADLDVELTPPAEFRGWHPFAQLQYLEAKLRLPSLVTHTLDRGAMGASVEARVPFLDHELVEFSTQIPPSLKMNCLREKYILRRAVEPVLPHEIAWRKKRGLAAPRAAWLQGPLPEFAEDLLSERRLRQKGFFDPPAVARLLGRHRAGDGDWAPELFGVLAVQVWDELFARRA